MFKQGDLILNRQKMDGFFFLQILLQTNEMVFVLTRENTSLERFYFKRFKKTLGSSKKRYQ